MVLTKIKTTLKLVHNQQVWDDEKVIILCFKSCSVKKNTSNCH